jgi:hypothetical protein
MQDEIDTLIASFVADLAGIVRRHAQALAREELARADARWSHQVSGQVTAGLAAPAHVAGAKRNGRGATRRSAPMSQEASSDATNVSRAEHGTGSTSAVAEAPLIGRLVAFYGDEWRQGRRAGHGLDALSAATGTAATDLSGAAEELVRRGWLVWREGTRDYVASRRMPRA